MDHYVCRVLFNKKKASFIVYEHGQPGVYCYRADICINYITLEGFSLVQKDVSFLVYEYGQPGVYRYKSFLLSLLFSPWWILRLSFATLSQKRNREDHTMWPSSGNTSQPQAKVLNFCLLLSFAFRELS